jgi:hypothetical protein
MAILDQPPTEGALKVVFVRLLARFVLAAHDDNDYTKHGENAGYDLDGCLVHIRTLPPVNLGTD